MKLLLRILATYQALIMLCTNTLYAHDNMQQISLSCGVEYKFSKVREDYRMTVTPAISMEFLNQHFSIPPTAKYYSISFVAEFETGEVSVDNNHIVLEDGEPIHLNSMWYQRVSKKQGDANSQIKSCYLLK